MKSTCLLGLLTMGMAAVDVNVSCDGGSEFSHFWKRSVGSSHAYLGRRADWRAQLKYAVDEAGFEGIRFHALFDDDMNVVTGTWNDPKYNWTDVDNLIDFLVHDVNLHPVMELSFMPQVLANCVPHVNCTVGFNYSYIMNPPYQKRWYLWHDLIREFVSHITDRYGEAEIASWGFEVWNELSGMPFPENYIPLYNASATAIKRVNKDYKVGGPATAALTDVAEFVKLAPSNGGADFISTHSYPSDPSCESSTDKDCFINGVLEARSQAPDLPFYITEFNAGLAPNAAGEHPRLNSRFSASFIAYTLPKMIGQLDVYSYWCFSDVFEERGLPTAEYAGKNYGMQTLHGIPKPSLRMFGMLKNIGTSQLQTKQNTPANESGVRVLATAGGSVSKHQVLVTFFDTADMNGFDGLKINTTEVTVTLDQVHTRVTATTINSTCANAWDAWKAMGSPPVPSPAQLQSLKAISEPCHEDLPLKTTSVGSSVTLTLESFASVLLNFY